MGPAYYVISILGCADGSAQCVPAATMPVHYASEATCRAAQTDALIASSDLDFPTHEPHCTAVSAPPVTAPQTAKKPHVIALKG